MYSLIYWNQMINFDSLQISLGKHYRKKNIRLYAYEKERYIKYRT